MDTRNKSGGNTRNMKEDNMYLRSKSGRNRMLLTLVPILLAVSLAVTGLVAAGCPAPVTVAPEPAAVAPTEGRQIITILHTNDLHGRIEPYFLLEDGRERGGLARIATVVNEIRQKEPNVILVDAGDTIHGTMLSDLYEGKSMISVMNAMAYDVMVAGNHDFHWRGADTILARAAEATFPIISANVIRRDTLSPLLPPFIFIDVGRVRIAFLGLTTRGTPGTVGHGLVADLEFLDPVEMAALYVPYLKERADLVIILAHISGAEEDKIAKTVPGVDVIVHGHDHARRSKVVNDTLIVAAGCWGFHLGYLRLTVNKGRIVDYEKRLIPITADIKEVPQIASLIEQYRRPFANYIDEVVGYTATDLIWGGWGVWIVARQQTNLGYLVTDAMRKAVRADIGLYTPWWIRDNMPAGYFRMCVIHAVLPFDWHKIILAALRGETIRTILEEAGVVLQAAGLTYKFDRGRPVGERVTELLINGKPVEMDKIYTVAIGTYMWEAGLRKGLFQQEDLIKDTGILVRDAVANHLREVRSVDLGVTEIEVLPKPW
ncbi:MAG: Mannosylglucosyl-3-phosphoglycerate phosphatase [Dehalococcoidia bacterium]|nr:Mannosylglucosyl-3-phosphoglycerate phosphatase [Chloroflexota bacterium]